MDLQVLQNAGQTVK